MNIPLIIKPSKSVHMFHFYTWGGDIRHIDHQLISFYNNLLKLRDTLTYGTKHMLYQPETTLFSVLWDFRRFSLVSASSKSSMGVKHLSCLSSSFSAHASSISMIMSSILGGKWNWERGSTEQVSTSHYYTHYTGRPKSLDPNVHASNSQIWSPCYNSHLVNTMQLLVIWGPNSQINRSMMYRVIK